MSTQETTATFRVGLVQMRASRSIVDNIAAAAKLIREAKALGADYILTPEVTNVMEEGRENLFAAIVEEERDPAVKALAALAKELGIYLHIGSLAVRASEHKAANRAFVFSPAGGIVARYDKIHMFDVDLPGEKSYRESDNFRPGESAVMVDLPWGRLGLAICYDLRFPALFRALAEGGASFLTVPAAFTRQTGEAHWHTLLKARAIENGCFVFAAAQGGRHENGRETFGHSLVVDPWGRVVGELAHDEPGVLVVEVDPAQVGATRARVPSLSNGRRFDVQLPLAEAAHLHVVDGGKP